MFVTPEGQALGGIDVWTWTRKAKGEDDIKESHRWIESYGIVADREGDIQELMEEARRSDYAADYLIRAQHNRCNGYGVVRWDMHSVPHIAKLLESKQSS